MARIVHILLCEDHNDDARALEELLCQYESNHPYSLQVTRASSVDDSLACLDKRRYDLVFLDVFLGQTNAIDRLGRIASGMGAEVIVVTSSADYALAAFGIDAVGYVLKPAAYEQVEHTLSRALIRKSQTSHVLILKTRNRALKLDHAQIIYCETHNHQQRIVLTDGYVEQVRMSGADMYAQLAGAPEFFRVGASFIINLDHVKQLEGRNVLMDNGDRLPVPRSCVGEVRDAYFEHWRRKACM